MDNGRRRKRKSRRGEPRNSGGVVAKGRNETHIMMVDYIKLLEFGGMSER
jgi:hypothetical protein